MKGKKLCLDSSPLDRFFFFGEVGVGWGEESRHEGKRKTNNVFLGHLYNSWQLRKGTKKGKILFLVEKPVLHI